MSSKRICPFEANLMPQMKVHVGLKEAADAAERDKEMKKIYERTLQLLRSGPLKLSGKISDQSSSNRPKPSGYHFEPPRMKQMVMNDKLELEHSTKIVLLPQRKHTCTNCGELKAFDLIRCFHCIEFYCEFCLTQCSKCLELYCTKCSLTIYDGGEHVECMDCYR